MDKVIQGTWDLKDMRDQAMVHKLLMRIRKSFMETAEVHNWEKAKEL